MMYPILCKVRYESLYKLLSQRSMWKQVLFSVILNWVVAPFLVVNLASPVLVFRLHSTVLCSHLAEFQEC